jgi:hypothetical protein
MSKGYILVESHGEVEAAANLVARLWGDLGLSSLPWSTPIRWKNLHREDGIRRGAQYIQAKRDVASLLVLRDEDDACPRETGPLAAAWLAAAALPFPSAVVLLRREYETLFLLCLHLMAGKPLGSRPGLREGARFDGRAEDVRGAKEYVSKWLGPGRAYKPTIDQLPLTRMLDFGVLRSAPGVPCFGTLERALRWLDAHRGRAGVVYPHALAES